MRKRLALLLGLTVIALGTPAWAHSGNYHLERLKIHAEAFLRAYTNTEPPPQVSELAPTSLTVAEQLERTQDETTWAENLMIEDIERLVEVANELGTHMDSPTSENYLQAKASLDSMARRLRVSSAAVEMRPEHRAAYDLLVLELDEATLAMDEGRQQLLVQRQQRQRQRNNWNTRIGLGFGWGNPYGFGYDPFGWNYRRRPFFYGRGYGRRCR